MKREEIIKKSKDIYCDNFEFLSIDKIKGRIVIKILCKKCGNIINQRLDYHLSGYGCKECKRLSLKDDFIKKCVKLHNNVFDYSMVNYINANSKIKIKCNKCDHIFNQRASAHSSGEGCPRCNIIRQLSTKEEFIKKSIEKHGDTFDYSNVNYKSNKIKVKIKCKKHNYIFEQTPNSHLRGNGCPICKESRGEKKIRLFLNNNKIKFIRNHSFEDCRYKKPLPFDFYLPEYNICIEYDGIQHFEDRIFDNVIENLKIRKIRDQIKNNYCKRKNILLIRIKYTEDIVYKLDFLIN